MKTLLLAFFLGATQAFAGETIRVAIGTQDTTINCAAGGPIVRELRLLEKYLPRGGNYKDAKYEITWLNLPTGAQLNSEILANRLDIVSMADFPSIVGHDAFLTQNNGVKTIYIASLSSGLQGAGNALLVPETSTVQNIRELKGKTVSVPFASTAHAFLLRAVKDQGWDPEKDITIITRAKRSSTRRRPDKSGLMAKRKCASTKMCRALSSRSISLRRTAGRCASPSCMIAKPA